MSGKDGLEFHDSGGDDVLFDQSAGQTHTFTNFPSSAVDDDEDSEDKAHLLKEDDSKRAPSFWTFEYYQQFFDVETTQVFHRVAGSMLPLPKRNYLQIHIRPNPDLYGPFWICTTLIFTTAIAGNLANYLSSAGKDYHWRYDFHKVTFAATAIFSYWWLIPAVMYGFLWWKRSQAGFTFLEILCVYGYSLAIYIPISILWVINVTWFKWVLVIVGAVLSGGVLIITFWPAVKEETKNVAAVFLGLIFLLHLGLAAGFLLYFFHVPPPAPVTIATTAAPTKAAQELQQSPLAAAIRLKNAKTGVSRVTSQKAVAPVVKGPGTTAQGVKSVETGASLQKIPESAANISPSNKLVDVNAGVESNVNIERKPTQVSNIDQTDVGGTGTVGGGVASAGGQIHAIQQPAGNVEEENKIRKKLEAGESRTDLETRDKSLNLGDTRKSRSSSDTRKRRKIIKKRNLA